MKCLITVTLVCSRTVKCLITGTVTRLSFCCHLKINLQKLNGLLYFAILYVITVVNCTVEECCGELTMLCFAVADHYLYHGNTVVNLPCCFGGVNGRGIPWYNIYHGIFGQYLPW